MSKAVKIWLIVAASLVLVGIIVFGVTMSMLKWNFLNLSTVKYETNTHEISGDLHSISINTQTADVAFVVSDDETCRVVCYEDEKMRHSVGVSNGELYINMTDTRKWYDHIGVFSVGNPMITVYLPKSENISLEVKNSTGDVGLPADITFKNVSLFGSTGDVNCYSSVTEALKIRRSTGDVTIDNISVGSIDVEVSTGKMNISSVSCLGDVKLDSSTGDKRLEGVSCKNFISESSTGKVYLKDVIASEKFDIDADSGDVTFDRCDANEISVETDTGDVGGTLLSDKQFFATTDTGDVDVPRTSGGKCEIETDTGDIRISIVK